MWGYLIFQNFWETQNGTWYHKTFKEHREIRKQKFSCVLFDYLYVHGSWTWKKKDNLQMPQQN